MSTPEAKTACELGTDYYVERGCVVFTAAFLARRGWCCGNGCRHCPFEGEAKRKRPVHAGVEGAAEPL